MGDNVNSVSNGNVAKALSKNAFSKGITEAIAKNSPSMKAITNAIDGYALANEFRLLSIKDENGDDVRFSGFITNSRDPVKCKKAISAALSGVFSVASGITFGIITLTVTAEEKHSFQLPDKLLGVFGGMFFSLSAVGAVLLYYNMEYIRQNCRPPSGSGGKKETVPVKEQKRKEVVEFKPLYKPGFRIVRVKEPTPEPNSGPSFWEVLGVTALVGAAILLIPKPVPVL